MIENAADFYFEFALDIVLRIRSALEAGRKFEKHARSVKLNGPRPAIDSYLLVADNLERLLKLF